MLSSPIILSAESVSLGNEDRIADAVVDAIVDSCLEENPYSCVSVHAMVTANQVVVGGNVSGAPNVNYGSVIRKSLREIGHGIYAKSPQGLFNGNTVHVNNFIRNHNFSCFENLDYDTGKYIDQSCVAWGYACVETKDLLPVPLVLAQAISRKIDEFNSIENPQWLRPDAEVKVIMRYDRFVPIEVTEIILFLQHAFETKKEDIEKWARDYLLPEALGAWFSKGINISINLFGKRICGGPEWNCGVSGRRLSLVTYGGFAPPPNKVLSGQDATKLDRSATYFARWIARQIVINRLADAAEVRISYVNGIAHPVSIDVNTRGTGNTAQVMKFAKKFDGRLGAIIERFNLRRPIYFLTAKYGHFYNKGLPWES